MVRMATPTGRLRVPIPCSPRRRQEYYQMSLTTLMTQSCTFCTCPTCRRLLRLSTLVFMGLGYEALRLREVGPKLSPCTQPISPHLTSNTVWSLRHPTE